VHGLLAEGALVQQVAGYAEREDYEREEVAAVVGAAEYAG
jgi:hypothetical protein